MNIRSSLNIVDSFIRESRTNRLFESLYMNEDLPGIGQLRIFKNPVASEFKRILVQFKSGEARGLVGPKGLFVWDSYLATHHDIRQKVGLSGERLLLTLENVKVAPFFPQKMATEERINDLSLNISTNENMARAFNGHVPDIEILWGVI